MAPKVRDWVDEEAEDAAQELADWYASEADE